MNVPGVSGFRPRFFIPETAVPPRAAEAWAKSAGAAPGGGQSGVEFELSPDDSHHALRVLRLSEGDGCEVVVGAAVYAATVVRAVQPVTVRLLAPLEHAEAGAAYRIEVGLVQALARPAVMEYVFEKGTEVGAAFFILVRAAGSPKSLGLPSEGRMARWRRIAREAAKQSKQVSVPSIDFAGSFESAVGVLKERGTFSLFLEPSAPLSLQQVLEGRADLGGLALWVGPESGWTAGETDRLKSAGVEGVRLGRSVLRTETAGPVAVAVSRLVLGDW